VILATARIDTHPLHVIATLSVVLLVAACAARPSDMRDNRALLQSVFDTVPESWQHAAVSGDVIDPLEVSPELRGFIDQAVEGDSGGRERILSIVEAILDFWTKTGSASPMTPMRPIPPPRHFDPASATAWASPIS
jgi:hypothetical protein